MGDLRGQYHPRALLERELRSVAGEARRRVDNARRGVSDAAQTAGRHLAGRALTPGELGMMRWMFGRTGGMERARVVPHNFWAPFPNRRAMTPDGNIYFHGNDYREDFSHPAVPVELRALFMHESTHLWQTYILGWNLMVRGPFDRNYRYQLTPGKKLREYGLEQMGQIVQDYHLLRNGRAVRGRALAQYADAVPVRE